MEFALVLPLVALLLALVALGGVVGMEAVHAQHVAREAARAAAIDGDAAAVEAARAAAGRRPVEVRLRPAGPGRAAGTLVTAEIELTSGAFARLGVDLRLPAMATMRVEGG